MLPGVWIDDILGLKLLNIFHINTVLICTFVFRAIPLGLLRLKTILFLITRSNTFQSYSYLYTDAVVSSFLFGTMVQTHGTLIETF